jgi:hypothetical protein
MAERLVEMFVCWVVLAGLEGLVVDVGHCCDEGVLQRG